MKRKLVRILVLIISITIITTVSFAHSGRTDGSGGHYNRSTGEYHYHHGKPAHQHVNGICPYEKQSTETSLEKFINNLTTDDNIKIAIGFIVIIFVIESIMDWFDKRKTKNKT